MDIFSLFNNCKDQYSKLAPDIYCLKSETLNLYTKIYKYIDLSALIDIMNGEFRVKLREDFSDCRENGELPLANLEKMLPAGQSPTKQDYKRWRKSEDIRNSVGKIPTSCFTLNENELYAMWKAFTTGYTGLRIGSTIDKFIESIDTEGKFEVYIGAIHYDYIDTGCQNFTNYIFAKNRCYQIEKEVRAYFIPKIYNSSHNPSRPILKIEGRKLISEIRLSPFLPKGMKNFIIGNLKNSYPELATQIRSSEILETLIK